MVITVVAYRSLHAFPRLDLFAERVMPRLA